MRARVCKMDPYKDGSIVGVDPLRRLYKNSCWDPSRSCQRYVVTCTVSIAVVTEWIAGFPIESPMVFLPFPFNFGYPGMSGGCLFPQGRRL